MWLRTIETWLLLLMIAIANGTLRVGVLIPHLGDYRAHVLSTVLLTMLIVGMIVPLVDWIGIGSTTVVAPSANRPARSTHDFT